MKPQLHWSALSMLSKCGEMFRRRYIEGEIIPPGVAAVRGTGVHKAIQVNLENKIAHGTLLTEEHVDNLARDAVDAAWDRGVVLSEEEAGRGAAKVRAKARDGAARLAVLHAGHLAPQLEPTHVERKFTLELAGYPLDLAGTIDIQEGSAFVRDTKTSAKSPNADAAERSDQLTMYALGVHVIDGAPPLHVALDTLVDRKRGAELRTLTSTRTMEDFAPLLARVENAVEVREKGAYTPARRDDWWCSPKWCGYFSTCRYVRNPKSVAVPATKETD